MFFKMLYLNQYNFVDIELLFYFLLFTIILSTSIGIILFSGKKLGDKVKEWIVVGGAAVAGTEGLINIIDKGKEIFKGKIAENHKKMNLPIKRVVMILKEMPVKNNFKNNSIPLLVLSFISDKEIPLELKPFFDLTLSIFILSIVLLFCFIRIVSY